MMKMTRNKRFFLLAAVILGLCVFLSFATAAFASTGGGVAENVVRNMGKEATWVVIGIGIISAVSLAAKRAWVAVFVALVISGTIAFFVAQPQTFLNLGTTVGGWLGLS